ncbi:hypothetical protein [uncultured Psychroserpens sp.]|uniref:hypothetical protein n=1 Tax=uncultured Psychroserpens sp. TaxID=255436 RepID=UPI00263104EC|nr:hypothetical protein [uncultured Psychroserpens sp.]
MKFPKLVSVVILSLLFSLSAFAQQSTEFSMTRNLGFKESSKVQTVDIKISEGTSALRLDIKCGVRKGDVTIEIYDPEGTKQGEFSVESIETEDDGSLFNMLKKGVEGQINKFIKNPQSGTWTIKFIPKNSTGSVKILSWQGL